MILFNTLTRNKEEFKPLSPPEVRLYTCGPTVYNYQHVGNYRTYVFEDALRRSLSFLGFRVRHTMNITDVGHLTSQADEGEDKVELEAARSGKSAWDIARFYTEAFLEDTRKLNIQPPDVLCKATDHIPEQIELVRRLEAKGFIYKASDGLYFDTSKFPSYGQLMGQAYQAGLMAGARVEANPEKRRPSDFAVWKFSPKDKKRQMEWDSPWGKGFPGWHIECSAMAMKYLGETLDIHCGGVDHIPIHHTNEIAQSEGATGKPFVRFWLHGEFLLMNSAKMAKSAGGFIRLADLQAKGYDPLDYRYLCLTAHYRKQLDFSFEALDAAKSALQKLRARLQLLRREAKKPGCADELEKAMQRFKERIADDLDMPGALAALWDALKDASLMPGSALAISEHADRVLGLKLLEGADGELPAELQALLERREMARKEKDFAASDALRKQLAEKGVIVEDTPSGQRWIRRN